MDQAPPDPGFRAGLADIAAPALACAPIGLVFGAAASAKGLSAAEIGLMAALVFAGGSQFAAIELWASPPPLAAIALSTLLVNARHLLMGASLAPRVAHIPLGRRCALFFFLTDESWSLAERRAGEGGRLGAAYLVALSAPIWAAWVAGCVGGALLGAALGDPARFGADFAFAALFIGLAVAFARRPGAPAVIAASAAASAGAVATVGAPFHVLAGAGAGLLVALLGAREGSR